LNKLTNFQVSKEVSADRNLFKKCNPIKFLLYRPLTLNNDKHLRYYRGVPDETTCFNSFFRCPSAL